MTDRPEPAKLRLQTLFTPLAAGVLLGIVVVVDCLFATTDMGLMELVAVLPREALLLLGLGALIPLLQCRTWVNDQRPAFQFRNFTFAVLAILFATLAVYHLSGGRSLELEKIYPSYKLWESAGGAGAVMLQSLFDLAAFIAVICCAVVIIGLRQLIYHNRKKHTARVFHLTLAFFTLVYLLDLVLAPSLGLISTEATNWGRYLQNVRDGIKALAIIFIIVNSFRLSWVKSTSKKEKWSCLGLSVLCLTGSIFMISGSTLFSYTGSTGYVCGTFFNLIGLFLAVYSGFAAGSLMLHLPTAKTYDRQLEEITSLHDLGRAVKSTLDLDQLVELITTHTSRVLESSTCWLDLRSETEDRFELVSWSGIGDEEAARQQRDHPVATLSQWVVRQQKPALIKDIAADRRSADLRNWRRKTGSLVCAPLLSGGEVIGILYALKDHTYSFEKEDLLALAAFADQAVVSIENAKLVRASLEKERMEQELKIAREVQMRLLPMTIPEIEGLDMDALSLPAYEVGGDYYDFITLDRDRLGVAIGDVSGKGTSAAFYMAEIKGILQGLGPMYEAPSLLLSRVNQILHKDLDKRTFITLLYAVISPKDDTLLLARAGHCPLYHLPGDAPRGNFITPDGIGLGLEEGRLFEKVIRDETVRYRAGDIFLFFSDGLVEAQAGDGEEFGEARLDQVMVENRHRPATEIKLALLNAVNNFKEKERLHDDLTLFIMKVCGGDFARAPRDGSDR
jgi:sigma-B regulation protein RsbU (phosphoserine phosphatase)